MSGDNRIPIGSVIAKSGAVELDGSFYTLSFQGGGAPSVTDKGKGTLELDFPSTVPFDPAALTQSAWNINAVSGRDSNSGLPGSPLKTFAELRRRWGVGNVIAPAPFGVVTITLETDLPVTDPITLQNVVLSSANGGTQLLFVGAPPTNLRTGTFTAVTTLDRATNTPWQGTDGAFAGPWEQNDRVILTSGANLGAYAWVAKDLGGGAARFSAWSFPGSAGFQTVTLAAASPGDGYAVQRMVQCYLGELQAYGDFSGSAFPVASFQDIEFLGNSLVPVMPSVAWFFVGTKHGPQLVPLNTQQNTFLNCGLIAAPFPQGGFTLIAAGLLGALGGEMNAFAGAVVQLDGDVLAQGCPVIASNGDLQVGTLGVFDAPVLLQSPSGAGVSLGEGVEGVGSLVMATYNYGTHALYGSGQGGPGVAVGAMGKLGYQANAPSITGTAGDFTLGGSVNGRAWDEVGGTYTTPRACSWSNLVAAIGGGGFAGNAHNVERDSHLVRTT